MTKEEIREGGVYAAEKAEELKKASKEEVLEFIRKELQYKTDTTFASYAPFGERVPTHFHRRFDMSGYEERVGAITTHNNAIIEAFAHLGIYDYYKAIAINFYQGCGELFFVEDGETEVVNITSLTTSQIIYEIFTRTILTDKRTRRRF